MLVDMYELAAGGLSNKQIAQAMGISCERFRGWVKDKEVVRKTLERARMPRETLGNFIGNLKGRMAEETKEMWEKLTAWHNEPNAVRKIEKLFQDRGESARQELFVNALFAFNFNIADACRFVNISRAIFNRWVLSEPGFAELIDEVREAMSDIFVSNLVKASNSGDVSATIFGCKTLAKDRGFAEKLEVEHTHKGSIAIEEMNLSPKILRELRDAFKEKVGESRGLPDYSQDDDDVIDVEYTKKEVKKKKRRADED